MSEANRHAQFCSQRFDIGVDAATCTFKGFGLTSIVHFFLRKVSDDSQARTDLLARTSFLGPLAGGSAN
jgi:hypothetical protein